MDNKINLSKYSVKKKLLFLLSSIYILWANSTFAIDDKDWSVSVIPFFWGVSITGDIEVGVPAEGIENQLLHISENFLGIVNHVHSGGMLDVNVMKGNMGLFLSSMYVNIKGINVTTSDGFEVQVNSKFVLASAGAFYLAYQKNIHNSKLRLGPYIGARYTWNDSSASLVEDADYNSSYSADWTEPFIGVTLLLDINKHWCFNLVADIGVLKSNQDSYNIIGLVGYKPTKLLTLYVGYRELYQSFTKGSGQSFFEWKMHVGGPIVGFAFVF